MRKSPFFIVWMFSLLIFTACEEVIEIDLNDADPRYVIEGMVSYQNVPVEVRISQTKNFNENNDFKGVSGAIVRISDDAGHQAALTESEPGIYQSTELSGVPGRSYSLRVEVGNHIFTATSAMPFKVPLDTVYTQEERYPGKIYQMPYARFRDPAGIANYYRFRIFVNGEFIKTVDVEKDEYKDGLTIRQGVYYFGNEDNDTPEDDNGLKSGDHLTLEMQCIDKEVYRYFFTLQQTIGQSSSAPSNPVSNIRGGALGYFSAFTAEQKSFIVE
jgi:hypothetical protein